MFCFVRLLLRFAIVSTSVLLSSSRVRSEQESVCVCGVRGCLLLLLRIRRYVDRCCRIAVERESKRVRGTTVWYACCYYCGSSVRVGACVGSGLVRFGSSSSSWSPRVRLEWESVRVRGLVRYYLFCFDFPHVLFVFFVCYYSFRCTTRSVSITRPVPVLRSAFFLLYYW